MEFKSGKKFFIFPLIGIAFVLCGGLAVMLLWNAILPSVIPAIGTLTFLQAIGLLILCRILFGGFRGRPGGFRGGPPWKNKFKNMTEEERAKFKDEWRQRCGMEQKSE
jgi:hypothetical protein